MYAKISDLPEAVRAVLDQVGYRRADIKIDTRDSVILAAGGQSGRRGFAALVNLATGASEIRWGSWGGANMFNTDNAVDLDYTPYPLPPTGVAIVGMTGGSQPVYASITCRAEALARQLASDNVTVTDAERDALYCYKSIKSGPYRTDEIRRRNVTAETIAACVARGWLKQASNGATSITTDGRNALGDYRGY